MATSAGPIKKQTIFTEIVDGSQGPGKTRKRPPLWDWLPSVPTEKWKAGDVDIYLYRYDPTTEKRRFLEKIFEAIDQAWVQKKYGGGDFNAMVHEDSQLIYNDDFQIEGAPKFAGAAESSSSFAAVPNSGAAGVEMMRMAMNPEIMRSMFEMFKMASMESMAMIKAQMPQPVDPFTTMKNVKELLGLGAPASNPMDDITKTFLQAAIQKMINPPETNAFKDTVTLINDIKSAGFLGAPPKTDMMSTFAANLPMIADRVVTGLREYRMQAEAAERTVRISRGDFRSSDPNVITVDPPAAHQSAADAPPPPPRAAAPTASTEISPDVAATIIVQANLQRLVQAMKNPDCTGEDICHFLSYVWPEMLAEMAATSKEHLMLLFKTPGIQMQRLGNTILSEMADDPRLPRLIDEFLIAVKKGASAEPAPVDPNAVAV